MDSPSLLARFPRLSGITSLLNVTNVIIDSIIVRPRLISRRSKILVAEEPKSHQLVEVDLPKMPRFPSRKVRKKRKQKPTFEVFEDGTAATVREGPAPDNHFRSRLPLKVRAQSCNSTPTPSPRLPDTPHLPVVANEQENYDPAPIVAPVPYVSTVTPMPPASPPPALSQAAAVLSSTFTTEVDALPKPQNIVLYDILGITDWNSTKAEILAAWRRAALRYHPERHSEEDHFVATFEMQKLNAAKEVLTDMMRRRHYHRTGILPLHI